LRNMLLLNDLRELGTIGEVGDGQGPQLLHGAAEVRDGERRRHSTVDLDEGREGGEGQRPQIKMEANWSQCEPSGSVVLEEWSGSTSRANIRLQEQLCSRLPPTKQRKNGTQRLRPTRLTNQTLP
jgi:hypothetical protein